MRVQAAEQDLTAAWQRAMRRGDFAAAWGISDQVLASGAGRDWSVPRHLQGIWDGRPLAGKRVLVRCYHGLGDTIQYARFWPRLARLAREVTVWAQPALLSLLARLTEWQGRLLPLHDGTPAVDYDADVECMEVPHALRTTLATLPTEVPYFDVPPAGRLVGAPDRLQVGVVTGCGDWNPGRAIPPSLLAPLAALPHVALCNLQPGSVVPGAIDLSRLEVLETAARVRALDLVISVDTMMAHLAGALGVPTWLMLPAEADWRWMEQRDDSPWYPTMRLFRQPRPGDWSSVMEQVSTRLQGFGRARRVFARRG
jgi:hypothetical protein